MTRSYGQFCPLARALDRIGDRWTPLVVRDLSSGPKRYSDLLAGLPGIGTTLLGERLKRLEEEGIVGRRELPPPAASTVFELTESGRELAAALVPLGRWGLQYLDAKGDERMRPEWLIMFWQERLDPQMAAGVDDVYEFEVDGEVFHVAISSGSLTGGMRPAPREPDVRVVTDWQTFLEVGTGRIDPLAGEAAGRGSIDGKDEAVQRFFAILPRPQVG